MHIPREHAMDALETIDGAFRLFGVEVAAINRIRAYIEQVEEALQAIRTASYDHYARRKATDALEGEKK